MVLINALALNIFSIIVSCIEEFNVPNITRKIIGGHDCSTKKYPFVVSLRTVDELEHFCGGNLIREDWVLTVAHCIKIRNPHYYVVVAGTSEINTDGTQRKTADEIYVHPKFRSNIKGYDIALMHLGEPFNLSTDYVSTINLPSFEIKGDVKEYCGEAMVIGWGQRNKWDPKEKPIYYVFNPILQCVFIPVLEDQQCIDLTKMSLTNNVFCAYYKNGTRDACQGDSGGPLFCKYTLYGLVSSGYGCGLPDSPGYYTRVDRYLNFIEDAITDNKRRSRNPFRSNGSIVSKIILNSRISSMLILLILLFSFDRYIE